MGQPIYVDGSQACPPEDVGRYPGYADFVRIMDDPTDPEHREMLDWYGGVFDPNAFDVEQANRLLKLIKL